MLNHNLLACKLNIIPQNTRFNQKAKGFTQLKTALMFTISTLLLTGLNSVAQAQQFDSIQGALAYPTSAERFFQEGRDKFDEEVKNIIEKRLVFSETLLQVREKLQIQKNLQRLEDPRLQSEGATSIRMHSTN
jgi:hypothetical protein